MPDPTPKPVERKRRTGNPGKRPLPDASKSLKLAPLTSDGPPPPPAHLGPAGAWLWQLLTDFAKHWLAPTDEALVRKLCEAEDRRSKFIARLESDGEVLYTDKGYAYPHPAVGMLSTLEAQMTKWYSLLGLSPADRTKLAIGEVQVQTTLDRLKQNRADG